MRAHRGWRLGAEWRRRRTTLCTCVCVCGVCVARPRKEAIFGKGGGGQAVYIVIGAGEHTRWFTGGARRR